jgi:hypothetical protein
MYQKKSQMLLTTPGRRPEPPQKVRDQRLRKGCRKILPDRKMREGGRSEGSWEGPRRQRPGAAPQLDEKARPCSEVLNAPDVGGGKMEKTMFWLCRRPQKQRQVSRGRADRRVGRGKGDRRPGRGRGAEGNIDRRRRGIQQLI